MVLVVSEVDCDTLVEVEMVVTLMLVELNETDVEAVVLDESEVLVLEIEVLVLDPPTVELVLRPPMTA